MATALRADRPRFDDGDDDRRSADVSPFPRIIHPTRPPRPELEFPLSPVEMLPPSWQHSPWHRRGIYTGFRSPSVQPERFFYEDVDGHVEDATEDVWVAITSRGEEVAFCRWGNWGERLDEGRESCRDRKAASAILMFAILQEIDPVAEQPVVQFESNDDDTPTCVASYRHVAPEHRAMAEAGTLMPPGLQLAPFRSPTGHPLMCVIDDEWQLASIVEVAAVGSPFAVAQFKHTFRAQDPDGWHPFSIYRAAYEAQLTVLPPGIHVAPWLSMDTLRCDEDYQLIALDRHSRFVALTTVDRKQTRAEAERRLRDAIADADPIVYTFDDDGPISTASAAAHDLILQQQFGIVVPDATPADPETLVKELLTATAPDVSALERERAIEEFVAKHVGSSARD